MVGAGRAEPTAHPAWRPLLLLGLAGALASGSQRLSLPLGCPAACTVLGLQLPPPRGRGGTVRQFSVLCADWRAGLGLRELPAMVEMSSSPGHTLAVGRLVSG